MYPQKVGVDATDAQAVRGDKGVRFFGATQRDNRIKIFSVPYKQNILGSQNGYQAELRIFLGS